MLHKMETQALYKDPSYLLIVAEKTSLSKLHKKLAYFASPAVIDYWISFPHHGYLLTDTFQRPVIHLSHLMNLTFLPLLHGPTTNPPIFLIFLDVQYHYNSFQFDGSIYPAPPVYNLWLKWRSEEAKDWLSLIQINLYQWQLRVPRSEPGLFVDVED
jgi:hypothetical protein